MSEWDFWTALHTIDSSRCIFADTLFSNFSHDLSFYTRRSSFQLGSDQLRSSTSTASTSGVWLYPHNFISDSMAIPYRVDPMDRRLMSWLLISLELPWFPLRVSGSKSSSRSSQSIHAHHHTSNCYPLLFSIQNNSVGNIFNFKCFKNSKLLKTRFLITLVTFLTTSIAYAMFS